MAVGKDTGMSGLDRVFIGDAEFVPWATAVEAVRLANERVDLIIAAYDALREKVEALPRFDPEECDRLGSTPAMCEDRDGDYLGRDAVLALLDPAPFLQREKSADLAG